MTTERGVGVRERARLWWGGRLVRVWTQTHTHTMSAAAHDLIYTFRGGYREKHHSNTRMGDTRLLQSRFSRYSRGANASVKSRCSGVCVSSFPAQDVTYPEPSPRGTAGPSPSCSRSSLLPCSPPQQRANGSMRKYATQYWVCWNSHREQARTNNNKKKPQRSYSSATISLLKHIVLFMYWSISVRYLDKAKHS